MNEVVPFEGRQQQGAALTRQAAYADAAVARLAEWATSASAAYEVARRLVGTSFVPAGYRGKPEEATAAILAGSEMGLSPMAALRAFDVIQGQAAPRAITLRAVVQSQGHQIQLIESTSTRCRMRGRRRDETEWQSVTWTMDRARELGLTSKDQWRKQPATMLQARATAELARLIAADAILGIAFSAEEVADADGFATVEEPAQSEPPASGTRRLSRRKPEPAPEPEGPPLEPEQDDHADPITSAQQRALHATLRDAGAGDRDAGLDVIASIIKRRVETTKDLTKAEASQVIDALKQPEPEAEDWPDVAEPGGEDQ